ncbi:hypothetical protein [Spongorhabdus nitratireducens]
MATLDTSSGKKKIREWKREEARQENDFTNTRPVIYRDVKVK